MWVRKVERKLEENQAKEKVFSLLALLLIACIFHIESH